MAQLNVTDTVLTNAVLDIFDAMRIRPFGSLRVATLETEWRNTKLRRDDLERGITLLLKQNHLQLMGENDDDPCLLLTQSGYDSSVAMFNPKSLRDRFATKRVLARAAKREADGGEDGRRERRQG